MSELSLAAQAIWNAWETSPVSLDVEQADRVALANALRAAADQLCLRWSELSHPADVLNNIADELDPQ